MPSWFLMISTIWSKQTGPGKNIYFFRPNFCLASLSHTRHKTHMRVRYSPSKKHSTLNHLMLEDRITAARHPSSCATQNNLSSGKIFCPHFEPFCTRVHLGPGGSSRRTRTRCTRWPTWRRSSATAPAAAWLKRPRDTPFLFPQRGVYGEISSWGAWCTLILKFLISVEDKIWVDQSIACVVTFAGFKYFFASATNILSVAFIGHKIEETSEW